MRVIAEGKESIAKLWGYPIPQNTEYRLMRYLVRDDCEDGTLLLNTVTGELVMLSREEAGILDALPMPYAAVMDPFIAGHFLVPNSFDDAKAVNQLRTVLRKLSSGNGITGYSILPTSACNARCFYCYESSYPKVSMTEEIADKLVDFIAEHCGANKHVEIEWFGGEPTVGESRIDQICDRLTERGITFNSTTLSNGYLFDKELAHKARTKWRLQSIQISMDGTEDVYNKTKAYVNAVGSPYQRVLDNIGWLLDEDIYVLVRMNLSFHNENDLKALIDELISRYGKRKKFSAYVHEVFADMGYKPVSYDEDELHQLINKKIALNRYIADSGCRVLLKFSSPGILPYLKLNYCMADNGGSLLVNPLGQFGKCDHYSFDRLIGDLESDSSIDRTKISAWMNHDYNEWCKECFLFPICGQAEFCVGTRRCYPEEIQVLGDGLKKRMKDKLVSLTGGKKDEKTSI